MGSTEWRTPRAFLDECSAKYGPFTYDAAATHENALCRLYSTKEGTFERAFMPGGDLIAESDLDGLAWDWSNEIVWCNPPYFPGAYLAKWVKKGWQAAQAGATVVMLLPVSTDTGWFHRCCWDKRLQRGREGVEVRFLEGRLHFTNPEKPDSDSPSGPNLLVVFHPKENPA